MKYSIFFSMIFVLAACTSKPVNEEAVELTGSWASKNDAVTYVFQDESNALWLIRRPDGSVDTLTGKYRFLADSLPMQLDFYDFETGMLNGKDVYGIVEFTSDTTFRFSNELAGSPEEALKRRPKTFSEFQSATFYKK